MSEEIKKGQVTNLPIPRYVSLKVKEANARRGPSLSHKIDWIYKRKNMPLEIYGEYENWRRVRDFEGLGGWVHYTCLLYTSDAADDSPCVDLGGRRII